MKIKTNVPALLTKGVKFDILVKRAKTGLLEEVAKGINLILDSGLTIWGSNETNVLTNACAVGDGTGPTNRDSGAITASRTGTTVSTGGAASFFEAGDVGRLIKWDSGEEAYIQTFNSVSSIETVESGTVGSGEFTIYYVDESILGNELARTTTKRSDGGDNSSTVSAGVITYKRTHLFPAVGGAVTYNEIGWSNSGTSNANLFNRALIGGGVSLTTGDQLVVVSNLEVVQGPQTPATAPDVGGGGFNSEGDIQIEGYGMGAINSSGAASGDIGAGGDKLEPSNSDAFIGVSEGTDAFVTYGSTNDMAGLNLGSITRGGIVIESPSLRSRTKSVTFPTNEANSSNINSLSLGVFQAGPATVQVGARVKLDAAQTKLNTETLAIAFKIAYGRTLVN